MKRKTRLWAFAAVALACCLLYGVLAWRHEAKAQTPGTVAKNAVVGKLALTSSYQTLTTLLGRSTPILFKGTLVIDSGDSSSVVIQSTISSPADDVPAAAGTVYPCSAINSDSVAIKGAASGDNIEVVGENVSFTQNNWGQNAPY